MRPGLRLAITALAAVVAALLVPEARAGANEAGEGAPIYVIGDLHGDYDAYVAILTEAGLIDDRLRWAGGEATLVQLGDIPDRGPHPRRIIDHLRRLERQAARSGGQVIPMIGNHEAMNVTADLRYVTAAEYEEFRTRGSERLQDRLFAANRARFAVTVRERDPDATDAEVRAAFDAAYPLGYVEHRRAWEPDGEIGRWVLGNAAVRVIDGTLFVHGGMSRLYADMTPEEINAAVHEALRTDPFAPILTTPQSPLWYRGNTRPTEESAAEVEAVLEAFGARRIVVGHTPALDGIRTLHGGRVIVVDTGISAFYGGTRSFLRIDGDRVTAVDDGVARALPRGGDQE